MPGDVTEWLARLRSGESAALESLVGLLYNELRGAARRQLRREAPRQTLGATALVHEVYLKLLQQRHIAAADRTEFLSIASRTMRRVLVDYARTKKRLKRGGGEVAVSLEDAEVEMFSDEEADEVLALDRALDRLAAVDGRASQVVEYRFYGGLTLEETATALNLSTKTVQRTWGAARAWLRKEISADLGE